MITYGQADNKITIGTIDSVQSNILNENRKIWVYTPNSSSAASFIYSAQKYPVVYLLDGQQYFHSVVGMIQHLSKVNGNTMCPEMIVVGIPNTIRERDLTPTKPGDDPMLKELSFLKITGGGEAFMSFMEKELIPYIDSKYPTQPYKMLIGHSLGGLAVMNTVINHTRLFNAYICIDPSMWWDNMTFLKTTKEALTGKDFNGTALYVGIANSLEEGMDIKKLPEYTATFTRHIRSILDMDGFIKNKKPKGLRYASKYYENETHGSVPLITTYDGLRFIFEKYQLKLQDKDRTDSTVALAEKIEVHYKEISKLFGYEVKPPESEINTWAYRFLQRKQYKKAEGFLILNMDNYPASFNVYDSYGDFYVAIGDKSKAIEKFQKALSIKENTGTRDKLNKLLE